MSGWPSDFWPCGAVLLHQQCWHWGRDVRSPFGNLLVEAGFTRMRPPEGINASSRYSRPTRSGPALWLQASGLFVLPTDEPGIYVNRYCFVPRWLPEPARALAHWRADIRPESRPPLTRREIRRTRQLLRLAVTEIAEYEDRILSVYGLGYRRESLREWPHAAWLPERMPMEWRQLSWHIPEPPVLWEASERTANPGLRAGVPAR